MYDDNHLLQFKANFLGSFAIGRCVKQVILDPLCSLCSLGVALGPIVPLWREVNSHSDSRWEQSALFSPVSVGS